MSLFEARPLSFFVLEIYLFLHSILCFKCFVFGFWTTWAILLNQVLCVILLPLMSCLYLSSKLRVMRFHMLRVNPVTPAPSEDLLIFPSSHDLSGCPCVRGPWRHTHTHTLACSANRHCVVIKERCVLSGWTGRAMSTCSGSHDLRRPSSWRSWMLFHYVLPPSTSRWHNWLSNGLILCFALSRHKWRALY